MKPSLFSSSQDLLAAASHSFITTEPRSPDGGDLTMEQSPAGAFACPPSGSRTKRPGSPGRTNARLAWKFAAIPWVYVEIVRQLSSQKVHSCRFRSRQSPRSPVTQKAAVDLKQVSSSSFPRIASGRVVVLFCYEEELAQTDWQFNAWAKYPNWHKDDGVLLNPATTRPAELAAS